MSEFFTRREFVGKGLGLIGMGVSVPYFLTRSAWAMQESEVEGKKKNSGRILVVLQLAGGNDGLNTVIPFQQDLYYKLRPQIAIPAGEVLKLKDDLGLHPKASGLKKLYEEGVLAIALGVGYPNPNRSHFVSTDIWSTADPAQATYTGWLGRYFDQCCKERDPKLGIAITEESPLALLGSRFSPICFESPDELRWKTNSSNAGAGKIFEALNQGPDGPTENSKGLSALDFVRRSSMDAQLSAEKIRKASEVKSGGKGRQFGKQKISLDQQLTMVSQMIAAGLPTRVYYVSLGGFDTHSNQIGRHQALMTQLGDSLASFYASLKQHKIEDRVMLMTFSEFGRRVSQNASGGTDHGTASPLFVLGASVKGGVYGTQPDLGTLESNDLRFTTDFRSVYSEMIGDWMGANTIEILGSEFEKLQLLRKS